MKNRFIKAFMNTPEDRICTIGLAAIVGIYALIYMLCELVEIIFGVVI